MGPLDIDILIDLIDFFSQSHYYYSYLYHTIFKNKISYLILLFLNFKVWKINFTNDETTAKKIFFFIFSLRRIIYYFMYIKKNRIKKTVLFEPHYYLYFKRIIFQNIYYFKISCCFILFYIVRSYYKDTFCKFTQ